MKNFLFSDAFTICVRLHGVSARIPYKYLHLADRLQLKHPKWLCPHANGQWLAGPSFCPMISYHLIILLHHMVPGSHEAQSFDCQASKA